MVAGGGQLRPRTATFAAEGAHMVVAAGRSLRVYSTVSGMLLATLNGHTEDVTSIVCHHRYTAQVYSASLDGTIRLWDTSSMQEVSTYRVGEPIVSMVVVPQRNQAVIAVARKNSTAGRVQMYSFLEEQLQPRNLAKTSAPQPLACGAGGGCVVTFDRHTLLVCNTEHVNGKTVVMRHSKPFTCVAVDDKDDILAAGDSSGRIQVWRGLKLLLQSQKAGSSANVTLPCTTVHWHAQPVGCLVFSRDSSYLMSGGHEAALVIWQLESNKKTFLPRLGGPLCHLDRHPTDPAKLIVCQVDNTLRVVNTATMQVEASVQGVKPPARGAAAAAASMVPGSGLAVFACDNQMLQFYDLLHDRHVAKLQVVPRAAVSLTPSDAMREGPGPAVPARLPAEPHITHLAFNADGTGLVTCDVRPAVGTTGLGGLEARLCFWDRCSGAIAAGAPPFQRNTCVDSPHSGELSSLVYHPCQEMVVSTSLSSLAEAGGGKMAVWVRQRRAAAPEAAKPSAAHASAWRCQSLAGFQERPMTAAAFSSDGSVLAVACGNAVTLWDPAQNELTAVLTPPASNAASRFTLLAFVTDSPYLVGASTGSTSSLVVWDVARACVWWSYFLPVAALLPDPHHRIFSVLVPPQPASADDSSRRRRHSLVVSFRADSPQPQRLWSSQLAATHLLAVGPGSALHEAMAGPAAPDSTPLLLLSADRQYAALPTPGLSSPANIPTPPTNSATSDAAVGAMEAVFGAGSSAPAAASKAADAETLHQQPASQRWKQLFDAPSHALPPPTLLCSSFLRLLATNPSSTADAD